MGFFIAISIILLLALCASYLFKKQFVLMLPIITASISLILYIFGFIGYRTIGVWAISLGSIILLVFSVYKKILHRDQIIKVIQSPGLIYILIISLLILFISRGFVFSAWDEFSHWGLVLKNMFLTDNFGNIGNATTVFRSYPPSITLFMSFFTSFSKTFVESSALRGILFLSFSQIAIIFAKIGWKEYRKIAVLLLITLALPLIFFESFLSTIYVDAIMGLIFGNILYFNHIYRKKDLFYAVYMSMQMYLLVNTKPIGIVFTFIAISMILVDYVWLNKLAIKEKLLSIFNKQLLFILIPVTSSALTWFSWKVYLWVNNIVESFDVSTIKGSSIMSLINGNLLEYQKTTVANFLNKFTVSQNFGMMQLSYVLWAAILVFVMHLIYRMSMGQKSQKQFPAATVVFFGFFMYSAVVLFMYLMMFSEYEATRLASIDRYIGSYLLGFLMLCLFMLIDFVIARKSRYYSGFFLGGVLLIVLFVAPVVSLSNTIFLSSDNNMTAQIKRVPLGAIERYRKMFKSSTDKVYIVAQNTKGFEYWVIRYNLTPVLTQPPNSDWSLGEKYSEDDVWTKNTTVSEWSKHLQTFTYVYLYSVDDRFRTDYGQLFESPNEIQNDVLYKVVYDDGSLRLKAVKI